MNEVNSRKPSATVLLSTYNGEQYLREQLDSVFAQEGVDIQLLVRDDGSKDHTIDILHEYKERGYAVTVLSERNCGAEMSFHRLCQYAHENVKTDYYAFCDQDDVWKTDKLQVAVKRLVSFDASEPCLYFSNLLMVDSNLQPIHPLFAEGEVVISKRMALIQVFTYGCTCVFNHRALEDYCQAGFSKELAHDNWIYILCMYLGHVVYDEDSRILYRQHGTNLSGEKVTGVRLVFRRIRRALKGNWGHDFELYSSMLLQCFSGRLMPEDEKYAQRIATYRKSLWRRMSLMFSRTYRTGNFSKDLAIRVRIIAGRL